AQYATLELLFRQAMPKILSDGNRLNSALCKDSVQRVGCALVELDKRHFGGKLWSGPLSYQGTHCRRSLLFILRGAGLIAETVIPYVTLSSPPYYVGDLGVAKFNRIRSFRISDCRALKAAATNSGSIQTMQLSSMTLRTR
ncbi:MAG TPA: hypothetical protein VG498_23145, partial [Terriglobales bacterium]|nr:hypothetical protein [Terriglobales bacterium]